MMDEIPEFDHPRFTDHEGELPRPSEQHNPHVCQFCGKPLPLFGLLLRHEEHCEKRPANQFEALLMQAQAKRMAGGRGS